MQFWDTIGGQVFFLSLAGMAIWFTVSIWNDIDCLQMALALSRHQAPRPMVFNIRTYNIRDIWVFGLLVVIWAVQKGNYNIMLLTEMNIHDSMYCRN